MLQTPGSLKNRDVSLTAFSPWGLGAFGEIIDESLGMQSVNERHTQRLTATQSSLSARMSVCMAKQQTGRGVCVCLWVHVWKCGSVRVCPCVGVCLSEKEEENGMIIPFFVSRNPFLLSLREHPGVMRDEPETAWLYEYPSEGRPVRFLFLFIPLFLRASVFPFRRLCNTSVWLATVVSELLSQTMRQLCQIRCDRLNASFFSPLLPFHLFVTKKLNACQTREIVGIRVMFKRKVLIVYRESSVEVPK